MQALLSAPNPDDPLDETVAAKWKSDEASAISQGAGQSFSCVQVSVLMLMCVRVFAVWAPHSQAMDSTVRFRKLEGIHGPCLICCAARD